MNGKIIQLRIISFINKQDATGQLLHDQIPGIDGSGARHEMSQNRVSDKDLPNTINGKFFQDWIMA